MRTHLNLLIGDFFLIFLKLSIFHLLKLFSTDPDVQIGKKDNVNEYYDEIIFHEPCQFFYQLLTNSKPLTNGTYKHGTDCKNI